MHQERRAVARLVVASTLLICLLAGPASKVIMGSPLWERGFSFFDLQCRGIYDKSIFARLDRICEDCYNVFREPSLHSLCSWCHLFVCSQCPELMILDTEQSSRMETNRFSPSFQKCCQDNFYNLYFHFLHFRFSCVFSESVLLFC
ncbi:unnamed protein product [Nesidiocoris tenuis]|uniref:Uncharacterized protein n=1 Tax=Nesidiocoris tenuis TaxID=355587 RepID=A0A6H5G919_9HEMI|nr:unnamed protein product [Nesidiocoris tenuis]CAB0010755.1 unnamed protein product [Nesidiocoris tenuis]